MTRMDLIGQRFGRYVVVSEVDCPLPRRFVCRCDCGEIRIVRMSDLRNGSAKSCGCLRRDRAAKVHAYDLTGTRFGRLVARNIVGKAHNNNQNVWHLDCDCGNSTTATTHNLMQGHVQSCGCLKKDIEVHNIRRGMEEKTVEGVRVPLLTQRKRSDNTSGHKGVSFDKRSGKWRAYIVVKGKYYDLGLHKDLSDAVAARKRGEAKYHKPYIDRILDRDV